MNGKTAITSHKTTNPVEKMIIPDERFSKGDDIFFD
jgi:hypothetical protein